MLGQLLVGGLHVEQGWRKIPMLTHQENFETRSGPMNAWFSTARAAELRPGIHAVSPFPVQPWLDVSDLGWAVAVVADSFDQADQVAGELALEAWDLRDQFSENTSLSLEQALRTIRSDSGSLILLHDMGDSLYAGSTGDSTLLLERILEERFSRKCFVPLVAPAIVEQARAAGIGSWIELPLSSEVATGTSMPNRVPALVSGLDSGIIKVKGLVGQTSVDEGSTALLRIDDVFVHVTELAGAAGADPSAYTRYGLAIPNDAVLVQKIAAAYPGFTADRKVRIQVNTPGLTQSNLSELQWLRAPRPLYGLDSEASYPPVFNQP
jgi:microcystin degradation protein MlrC